MLKKCLVPLCLIVWILGCQNEEGNIRFDAIVIGKNDTHLFISEYVTNDVKTPAFYRVITSKLNVINVGQKATVTLRPNINASSPPQATAKTIVIDKEFDIYQKAVSSAIQYFQDQSLTNKILIRSIGCQPNQCTIGMSKYDGTNDNEVYSVTSDLNGNIIN